MRGETVLDWDVEGTGPLRRLVVRFRRRPQSGGGLEWHVERPPVDIDLPGEAGATVDFPAFRAEGVERQWNRWSIAVASNVSVEVPDGATNLSTLSEGARPEWLELSENLAYKLGFHSRRADPRLQVTVRSRDVWTSARSTTVVRVAGTHVDVNTRFRLTVERTGLSTIGLRLPLAVDESTLTVTLPGSSARREVETTDGVTTITLTPPSPLIGVVLIDLAYRVPRAAGDTRISLGGWNVGGSPNRLSE